MRGLVAGLVLGVLLVAGVVWVGAQPRDWAAGYNGVPAIEVVAVARPGAPVCQAVAVPAGTGRVELVADGPASLTLQERSARPVRTRALNAPAGRARFALPRRVEHDHGAQLCVSSNSRAGLLGAGDAVSVRFLRAERESTIAMLPVIAGRIGRSFGALGGAWRGVAIPLLLLAGIGLTARLATTRERSRPLRRVALVVGLVATCNALAWSLITPALQIPDESAHLSYVQDLAEKNQPPRRGPASSFSPELSAIIAGTRLNLINFNPLGRPPWSEDQARGIAAGLAAHPSRVNPSAFGYQPVADYPPLYYGAMVPVYAVVVAAGGSSLDALTVMRLLTALLAGVTVAALLGFLLELLPGRVALATLVALVCAYQPVLTWIGGGVNPDALLIALTTTMLWLFARAWRRGLSLELGVLLGAVLAGAILTKVAGLGLVPGWAAGVGLLVWRGQPEPLRRRGLAALAAVLAVVLPLAVYSLLNTQLWDRPLIPIGVSAAAEGGDAVETSGFAGYLWQYFLPPVGGMTDFFGSWSVRDLWVPNWVGRFGWYDYTFPTWVARAALLIFGAIGLAALVTVVRRTGRDQVPRAQLLVVALVSAGLVVAVARAGFTQRASGHLVFEQARYVMPLVAAYAAALALALLAVPHGRPRAAAATVLLVLAVANLLGAFGLTVQRYFV